MCSGLQPAMTPIVAIFSTVALRFMGRKQTSSPLMPERPIWNWRVFDSMMAWNLIISSGLWLVPLSIAATRSSVGRTMGRPSAYLQNSAPLRAADNLGLLIELFGLFEGAFKEYSGFGDDYMRPFFSLSVRGLVRASDDQGKNTVDILRDRGPCGRRERCANVGSPAGGCRLMETLFLVSVKDKMTMGMPALLDNGHWGNCSQIAPCHQTTPRMRPSAIFMSSSDSALLPATVLWARPCRSASWFRGTSRRASSSTG